MSKLKMTACMKLVAKMSDEDQGNLVDRLDRYTADGVPPQRAQVMAASDTLAELEAERKQFMAMLKEQHPDIFLVKPEAKAEPAEMKASKGRGITEDQAAEIIALDDDLFNTVLLYTADNPDVFEDKPEMAARLRNVLEKADVT